MNNEKPSSLKEIINWILCIVITIAVGLSVRTFVFELVRVDGDSMNSTLTNGEVLFVEKISRYGENFERGDIVIVHYPGSSASYVKRIVALPGDTVSVADGKLYLNGEAQDEPYINTDYINGSFEATVEQDHIFVMGDNRNDSLDSRFPNVGAIPYDSVVGHALAVIWPLGEIQSID